MAQVPFPELKAAIHKSAAARAPQVAPPSAPPPTAQTDTSALIRQDLGVLANQAAAYATGQAAGNAQAATERQAITAGLTEERAQADTARNEELAIQRRERERIALQQRAAEQQAAQQAAAISARVNIEKAEAAERTRQNQMRRAAQAAAMAEDRRAQAEEAEFKREQKRADSVLRSLARTHTDRFMNVMGTTVQLARTPAEAREFVDRLTRQGEVGMGPGMVSRRALDVALDRFYRGEYRATR